MERFWEIGRRNPFRWPDEIFPRAPGPFIRSGDDGREPVLYRPQTVRLRCPSTGLSTYRFITVVIYASVKRRWASFPVSAGRPPVTVSALRHSWPAPTSLDGSSQYIWPTLKCLRQQVSQIAPVPGQIGVSMRLHTLACRKSIRAVCARILVGLSTSCRSVAHTNVYSGCDMPQCVVLNME